MVKPYPGEVQMGKGESPDGADPKKIHTGSMGAKKKGKRAKKGKKGGHNAADRTDDEPSAMMIANPDSFLGAS